MPRCKVALWRKWSERDPDEASKMRSRLIKVKMLEVQLENGGRTHIIGYISGYPTNASSGAIAQHWMPNLMNVGQVSSLVNSTMQVRMASMASDIGCASHSRTMAIYG